MDIGKLRSIASLNLSKFEEAGKFMDSKTVAQDAVMLHEERPNDQESTECLPQTLKTGLSVQEPQRGSNEEKKEN